MSLLSPLGNTPEQLWDGLQHGASGVRELAQAPQSLPIHHGAEARCFTGAIEDFGPLDKTLARTIKKGLKIMCRDMQMGVAAAQRAIHHAGLKITEMNRDRFGVIFGADYMCTLPEEFTAGIQKCCDAAGKFHFEKWGEEGLAQVEPLWLLKYLPNLPASHVAIFNDLHGPNNSITMGEAGPNLAAIEAYQTIVRGHAEQMIVGATGTRIHPIRMIQAVLHDELATGPSAAALSRPFDLHRKGSVIGEGAAALVLEELESALARGATIVAEILGGSSSTVSSPEGKPNPGRAIENVLARTMTLAGLKPESVGHVHAHAQGQRAGDAAEAQAIERVFGARPVPVVAAKGNLGNLGASSGIVETIASIQALQHGHLFRTLNYETPDPACPIAVVRSNDVPAGDCFINVNVTPAGQASGIAVRTLIAA
jgi:3-oxoacyl-[acyl-carrier-protein] synthase II